MAGDNGLEEYRAAFEQSRDAIMTLSAEGFRNGNPAALTMFRVPDVATFATLHPGDLSPTYQPDGQPSQEAAAARIDEAMQAGQAFFEWRHQTWDGVEFQAEVLLSRIDLADGPLLQAVVRDISERKALEETHRRQKAELEEAQRIGRVGSWVWDITAGTLSWSDEIYRIFGVAPQAFGATYEAFLDFVHPDDRALVDGQVQRALAGEIQYAIEHRIQTPAGAERTVHERAEVERNAAGEPIRMVGTVQDVTQQAELEGGLKRLVAILDNTPDYVALHDAHGTVRYLNAAARRYLGLPAPSRGEQWRAMVDWEEAELPAHMSDVEGTLQWVHPDWAAAKVRNEGIPSAVETGSWQGETALLRSDGQETPMSQVILVHRDGEGNVAQYSTIMRDISERRALESQLRREKALFESILNGLPGIFYMADEAGRLVQWNDRMEAVTGLGADALGGIDALALVPEEEAERITGAIQEVFADGSTLVESKLHTVEGDTPYLLNGLRVELDGRPYLLGVGLDISEQKRLEAALEREATTDRLTGLYNRQRFDVVLERLLAGHRRYGTESALIMLDLDHFKAVNDDHGHDVGDRVLVELAERLGGAIREPDVLARWGGEEFVILLPETGLSEALQLAERLRRRIEAEPFPEVGTITISLGVTGFRPEDTANTLMKRVDDALYRAKEEGRNRVAEGVAEVQ